jgi:asparagine synthetase B (glutamine-hydrolysing)
MAAVCHHGSYEPNAWTTTPLLGWRRIRRGAVTFLARATGDGPDEPVEQETLADTMTDEDGVAAAVREAFVAYGRSQAAVRSSIVELSGGYDSTLAVAAARTPAHDVHGVSVEFPYYEFRHEAPVQRAVATALAIPRRVLDGTTLFPYAPWRHPPRFDEPTVFVTGIRHAEEVAACAAARGATRIYVGHGGDQLFSTDLEVLEPTAGRPDRAPFSREAWSAVLRSEQSAWRQRHTGCFVYDARPDVWVKETFGPTLRTPFSDNAVFRAARAWSRHCAARGHRPDKTILARAVGDLLPNAVTGRKGKVAYDGVWMRAYSAHGEHIGTTLERVAGVLEHIGVDPAWLIRRTRQLAEWEPVSGREVLAAYSIAAWLVSWGVERVSDVAWD